MFIADVLIKAWNLTRFFNSTIVETAEKLKGYILGSNIPFGLAFILLQTLSVILIVLPAGAVSFLGGAMFGGLTGFLYSMIGTVAGGMLVFFLTRLLGRPFVRRMLKKKTFEKYEKKFNERSHMIVLVFMIFPIMPADVLCYLMGLTKMKWWHMLILNLVGRPWRTILYVALGASLSGGIPLLLYIVIFEAAVFMLFLAIRYGGKFEAAMFKRSEARRRKRAANPEAPGESL